MPAGGVAVAAGFVSAVFYLLPLMIGSLGISFVFLVPVPLFLAGLALGLKGLAFAVAAGLLVVMGGSGTVVAGVSYAALFAGPVLVTIWRALSQRPAEEAEGGVRWSSAGSVVAWLAAYGVVLLFLALALVPSPEGLGLEETIRAEAATLVREWGLVPPDQVEAMAQAIAELLPGIGVAVWVLFLALQGGSTQVALRNGGKAIRPTPDFRFLRPPDALMAALAAAAVIGLFVPGAAGYAAQNAALVLVVPYVFVGCGVVHVVTTGIPGRRVLLVLFYGLSLVLSGLVGLFVTLLGVVEHWADFRGRYGAPRQS